MSNAPSKQDFALWAFTAVIVGMIILVSAGVDYVLQNGHPLWISGALMAVMMVVSWFIKDDEEEQQD